MSDDKPTEPNREIARRPDLLIGPVPLSKPTIVLPPPVRPFPARALRYGPGQPPILERET